MDWGLALLRGVLFASLVVSLYFLYYSLQNRETRGATSLAVIFTGCSIWILSDIFQIATPGEPMALGGLPLRMIGADLAVIGIVLIGLEYTGREKYINRKLISLLAMKPILTQIFLFFPETRRMMFVTEPADVPWGYEIVHTPFFLSHAVYDWTIALIGISMLAYMMIRERYGYSRQIFALLIAFIVPTLINILFNAGILSFDLTPTSFVFSGIVLMYATFRLRLMDAIPVARESVLEEMEEMVIVLDEKGNIVMVNDAVKDIFGPESLIVGEPVKGLLGDDVPTEVGEGERTVDISFRHDGEDRYLNVEKSLLTDYRGNVLAQLLVCRDITERRERERELERSRELLAQTEELSDIGGWEYVPEADDVRMTDGMYSILDVSDDYKPTPASLVEFYLPEYKDRVEDAIEGALLDEEPFSFECRITTDSGEKKWVTVTGKPYYGPNTKEGQGEVRGLRGAVRDITEEKRRQKELENKNEQLDQFATTVSHDLRNPLNIAMAHLEFARETGDEENFDSAEEALKRIDGMIEDILEFARAGGDIEETETISVAEVAERAWATVETDGGRLSIKDDVEVEADEERLLNVFENLFRNSVEHGIEKKSKPEESIEHGSKGGNRKSLPDNPSKKADITVTVGELNGEDGFYVEDDGRGITPGERENVLKQGYTTSDDGNGFGLAIVDTIIKAHGWGIDVTEGTEGGARFEIRMS